MGLRITLLLRMVTLVTTKGSFRQGHVRHGDVCWKQPRRSRRIVIVALNHLHGFSGYLFSSLFPSIVTLIRVLCHCKLVFGLLKTVGRQRVACEARELSRGVVRASPGPRPRAIDCSRHCDLPYPCKRPYQRSNGCTLFWRRCKVINTAHVPIHGLTRAQVFEQLKKPVDPKVIEQRERELNERAQQQYERAQQRQAEIVSLDGLSGTMDIL